MTHTIPIPLVPPQCLLKILYKVNNETLCRLRQTCKKFDEYVEFHRWRIVRRLFEYKFSLAEAWWYIDIGNKNCEINRFRLSAPRSRIVIQDPFKQLSAIRFCQITLKYNREMVNFRNIGKDNVNSTQNFIEFVGLLKKLKLHCNELVVLLESGQDDVEKVLNCIYASTMDIRHEFSKDLSIQELLSCKAIQRLNSLNLEIRRSAVWTIPDGGLLKYLKNIESLSFKFRDNTEFGFKFARLLAQEIYDSSESFWLSKFNFDFDDEIDPTIFLKKYYLVWKRDYHSSTCLTQKDVFAEERPSNYIILRSRSSIDSTDVNNIPRKRQNISIDVCRKTLAHLKYVLWHYAGDVEYFDHIVEMIQNCASK